MRRQRAIEVKRRLNALQRELHATRGRTAARMVEAEKREAADALRAKSGNHALKRLLRGVEPADEATMTELSTTFNRRMRDTFADPSWIKLFRSIDTDHSGLISFQEIMALTRDELSLLPEDISDEQLKAFWLALDMDQSGFVGCGEFGAFMRKGEQVLQSEAEKTTWKAKLKAERKRRADRQRAARDAELNRDLSRANADGALQPAKDEEVTLLSRLCNERLATLYGEGAIHSLAAERGSSVGGKASLADPTKALTAAGPVHGALSQATWFSLFKRTDENDSGLICFHEWTKLIRTELGVKERHFPKQRLQACWLALDVDSSGFINAGEWAAFMRRGEPDQLRDKRLEYAMSKKYKARELYAEGEVMRQQKMYNEVVTATRNKRAAAAQRERDAERLKAAHRSHAEEVAQKRKLVRDQSDMTALRRVLQSAPRATDEQVVRLAEACNEKLVAMADEAEKAKWAPWFRLFKSVDTDGSGQISFDEFVALVRNDLGLAHDGFSSEAVKAVWVAMDIDASGYISCGEFAKFMRRGAHVIAGRKGPSREEVLAERARLAKARRTADQLELYHGRHFDELASAAAASEADVKRLSVHFNARLRELREYELGIGGSHHASEAELRSLGADTGQWYHLFKRVDANANGYISFSEFSSLVRDELMLPESNVPNSVLRAVWRALDPSSSGLLQCGDFIAFMKQGMPEVSRNANAGAVARERVRQNGEWRRASYEQQRSQRKHAQLQVMDAEQRAYERRASALQRELEMELAMVRQTVGGVTQAMPVLPAGLPVDVLDDGSAAVHGRRVGQAEPMSGQQASRAMRKQEAAGRREGAKAGGRLKGAQSMSLLPSGGRASRPMVSSLSEKTLVRLPKI